jgi:heme-degrading monooxygenase HmoA
MVDIHIRLKVRDFDSFWHDFQHRGAPLRAQHGSQGVTVLRSQDDPQAVHLRFTWDSRERFAAFLQDPVVQDSLIKSGVIGTPEVEHLNAVGSLPN